MDPSIRLHQILPLVEHQHSVIEQLRARHPKVTTARQLAELVGVSSRTIERDAARLREAGVPLEVTVGLRGGYRLAATDRDCQVRLSPGEVSALIAALVSIGPYSSATARSAFDKLIAALGLSEDPEQTPT
ncbi:helix-turn-helix transcriptional regulator [Halosaccharopolyspora lacisalsi]|uniref:helix-turn-helix transcriptional regulator n=1 Tax=Halosaccharopolyspora lacisalsi TaxID=1000566 RepID=UPI0015FAE128|nr:HTH domain-containing protein [Halosaccharopolyspora lacisalsi]